MDSTITAAPTPESLAGQDIIKWFSVNLTVSIIALILGLLIIIIAYFAGGRENKNKLLFSVLFSTIVAALSMPLFLKLAQKLGILKYQGGWIFIIMVVIIFVATMSCHAYEIVTVSAKEARPPQ